MSCSNSAPVTNVSDSALTTKGTNVSETMLQLQMHVSDSATVMNVSDSAPSTEVIDVSDEQEMRCAHVQK